MKILEEKFLPIATKISKQRHITAIRKGFLIIMPLVVIGAIIVLINNLPVEPYQNLMTKVFGESWKSFGANVWQGTIGILSLLLVFTIAYFLGISYKENGFISAILSFACLVIIFPGVEGAWAIPFAWAGSNGIFVSIIVAIITTEIFVKLSKIPALALKTDATTIPIIAEGFKKLLPALITLSIFTLYKLLITKMGAPNPHLFVFQFLQKLTGTVTDSLPFSIYLVFLVNIFWFFGLHGANILGPIIEPSLLSFMEKNIAAFGANQQPVFVATKVFFDVFVYMGGAGTALAIIIAIYITSKKRNHYRDIANLSVLPILFNINESVLFGIPVIFNPIMIIPFIIAPIVLTIVSYFAIVYGIVPPTVAYVSWTMPPIIGGYLATKSFMGAILQVVNLAIAVLIYYPFVKLLYKSVSTINDSYSDEPDELEKEVVVEKKVKPKKRVKKIKRVRKKVIA